MDGKMREIRDGGKVIGAERIAVITALNMANELLLHKRSSDDYAHSVDSGIKRLSERIDLVLRGDNERERE